MRDFQKKLHKTYKVCNHIKNMNQETKYSKFNWKEFFKVTGSIFFIFLGAAIGVYSNGKIAQLILGFAIASVGIGLMFTD